jgi:S1-C subfamily serine protease
VKTVKFCSGPVAAHPAPKLLRWFLIGRGSIAATFVGLLANNISAQTLLTALDQEIRHLVEAARPAVVTIVTTTLLGEKKDTGGLFGIFSERDDKIRQVKIGSGLIVSSDGFIVTKKSVVSDAIGIEVTLATEQSFPAELVALDSLSEIAVIKLNRENLPTVRIGPVSSVQPGSWVTVIGNALGMPQAISVGVVSAVYANGIIQISANVDPGSNGSPVFNVQGKAIGIISGRMGFDKTDPASESYFSGTALVHPLETNLERLREFIRHYYQTRGWLGVTVVEDPVHPEFPKIFHLVPDGPAERAGLLVGDVITHFADQPIASFTKLRGLVAACRPGEGKRLTVIRQDSVLDFNVQIGQQTPTALFELQLVTENDASIREIDDKEPPAPVMKSESWQIRRRIQALEKELRLLKSMQQKP